MRMRTGDLLDRYTILLMKSRSDEDAARELPAYEEAVRDVLMRVVSGEASAPTFLRLMLRLMEGNAKTWVTEAAMREGSAGEDDLSESDLAMIGRRALRIRGYNKIRVTSRSALDVIFGDLPDNKVDHASE